MTTVSAPALLVEASDLALQRTLRVASFTLASARTAIARLEMDGAVGYGEAAPLARYGDSVEAIVAFFETFTFPADAGPFARRRVLASVPRAARCALDIAMYDLAGRLLDVSVTELLGLAGLPRPLTSQTIWVDELDAVVAQVDALRDVPILKVKVGGGPDAAAIELIETIRSQYTGTIRLDINEGWTPEQAVTVLGEIARFEIEVCEQPIPAGSPEKIGWISEHSKIPIMIDEDALVAADLAAFAGKAGAVCVKLAKCGGIGPAVDMIATARALGMKVMIGCMAETRILATAAAHVGPLADWLDLDGPLLLKHDPYRGVDYDGGRLVMPAGSGLGVEPVAA